VNKPGLEDGP